MLRHKPDRRGTAELNGYTARRLNEMALSLSSLARSCADGAGQGQGLSKEDGLAAVKAAADLVCGSCEKCGIYRESTEENSYFLYYLLRAFEQKGKLERGDMPQMFLETCGQSEEYIYQLNRSLGRATMNLAWKNRFLESRDTVISQFRELAVILEEFARQMEAASDVTSAGEKALKRAFRQKKLAVSRLLILEYESGQREVFADIRAAGGRCMTAKDACRLIGQALGGVWTPAREGRNIITRTEAPYRFTEEGKYRLVYGVAGLPRDGETVSGDSYTFNGSLPGQVVVSLSDGMGSGEQPGGGADGGASGDGIFRQGGPENGQYGAPAGGGRTASGHPGSGVHGLVHRSAGNDENGGGSHFREGRKRRGDHGGGRTARRRHTGSGAGAALEKAVGGELDRDGERRHFRRPSGRGERACDAGVFRRGGLGPAPGSGGGGA